MCVCVCNIASQTVVGDAVGNSRKHTNTLTHTYIEGEREMKKLGRAHPRYHIAATTHFSLEKHTVWLRLPLKVCKSSYDPTHGLEVKGNIRVHAKRQSTRGKFKTSFP